MSEYKGFTRVKDPQRPGVYDILVLPAGEMALRLSPKTLGKLGMSVGTTSRSDNLPSRVKEWITYRPGTTMFFVQHVIPAETPETLNRRRLLGFAPTVADPVLPLAHSVILVPFGSDGAMVPQKVEAAAWSRAREYVDGSDDIPAISKMLFDAGVNRGNGIVTNTDSRNSNLRDTALTQLWDRLSSSVGPSTTRFLPNDSSLYGATGIEISDIVPEFWPNNGHNRLKVYGCFIPNMVKRGALLLRPDQDAIDTITAQWAAWYAKLVADRFAARASFGKTRLDDLRRDIATDTARSRLYGKAHGKFAMRFLRKGESMMAQLKGI